MTNSDAKTNLSYYGRGFVAGIATALGESEALIEIQPENLTALFRLNIKLYKIMKQNMLNETYPHYNYLQYLQVRGILRADLTSVFAALPKTEKKRKRKRRK